MLAARGLEGLIRTVDECPSWSVAQTSLKLMPSPEARSVANVKAHLLANPLKPGNQREVSAGTARMDDCQPFLEVHGCAMRRASPPVPPKASSMKKRGLSRKTGDRLAFNGSLNETEAGWTQNWESLNIFRSWFVMIPA